MMVGHGCCWRQSSLLRSHYYSAVVVRRLGSGVASRSPLPPSPRIRPPVVVAPAASPPPSTATSASAVAAAKAQAKAFASPAAAAAAASSSLYQRTKDRGPVSWTSLFLVTVAAASAVGYYSIEREKRLERAMGQVVSSELLEEGETNTAVGWSPRPEYLAKRKFVPTKYGWFPIDDGFGAPGKPAIGGPWSLVDLDGNLVTNKSFEGKWILLYFGFARCPDICPSEMMKVGRVMDTLKKERPDLASQLVPLFVSIDPARDSLQALRAYAKDFHPSYIFLTGAPAQVQRMAKLYRVYFSKADESEDGDYLVDHSIVIYFHDHTGDLSDCFTQSMRPTDVVAKIIERMEYKPEVLV